MKKILVTLISFTMFFLLTTTCTIYITREITSEKTIKTLMKEINDVSEDNLFVNQFTAPLATIYPDIGQYFSEEEFQDEITTMLVQLIENLGDKDVELLVDTTNLKNIYSKNIKKYEESTGKTVPEYAIADLFHQLDQNYNIKREKFGEAIVIFEAIASDELFLSCISGIVLCIILIFALLGKINDTLLKIKTPIIVNGTSVLIIGILINQFLTPGTYDSYILPQSIIGIFTAPFFKVGITSIAIGVGLVIVSGVLKHNKSIENSNNALENLGNVYSNPNTSVTNTPYNGYQNH